MEQLGVKEQTVADQLITRAGDSEAPIVQVLGPFYATVDTMELIWDV